MIVDELIAALQKYEGDRPVVILRGRESEHASVLHHVREMMYVPHTDQAGYVFVLPEADQLSPQAVLAVILRPAR